MSAALNSTGRPILVSVCSYENYNLDYSRIANMWCSSQEPVKDVFENWVGILAKQKGQSRKSGIGAWNYPSVLLVGRKGNQTFAEQIGQFSMWSLLNSPLFLDLRVPFNNPLIDVLTDRGALSIDDNVHYPQGDIIITKNDRRHQVWAKRMSTPPGAVYRYAVAFFVDSDSSDFAVVSFTDLGIPADWTLYADAYDIWRRKSVGEYVQLFGAMVSPRSARVFIMTFYYRDNFGHVRN
jgi:hypothetical protein